ncbi:pyridine nucleotide-disulfide oxidoreductase [Bradyrhizobium sp.]|uniref:pyridine nucleotide-disulfide oxidoreductase n=1 Tax=Bradyrhizobium sp. TaxID=376 RepID=UPI003C788441
MADSAVSGFPVERVAARRRRDTSDDRAAVAASGMRTRNKAVLPLYRARLRAKAPPVIFGIAVTIVLWVGWLNRDDGHLTPESGIGYWLGIVGSSLMLLLLFYPLRKRMRSLRALGTVVFWFRAHMILGILGPVLVILHSNFKLGSINSNVALAAMLVVALSGVVGRYLYGKIHRGMYGCKAEVREILADACALNAAIGADLPVANHLVERMSAFSQIGTLVPKGIFTGLFMLPVISARASIVRMRLMSEARQIIAVEGKRRGWSQKARRRRRAAVDELLTQHVAAVKKAAAFAFYERLFRLWHVFHLPLFFLLIVAAIIHIFAAHFF